MRTNLAKTLLTASALAVGLCNLAHAGTGSEAPHTLAAPAHTGPRDPFTDGARALPSEAAMLAVSARAGMSVCKVRGFDPYQDGLRLGPRDPYADGARISSRDGYTDGARIGPRDPYTDGGGRVGGAGGDCLSRSA